MDDRWNGICSSSINCQQFSLPLILPSGLSDSTEMALTAAISAPIGEEIFKLLAVCLFLSSIRNPKKDFKSDSLLD